MPSPTALAQQAWDEEQTKKEAERIEAEERRQREAERRNQVAMRGVERSKLAEWFPGEEWQVVDTKAGSMPGWMWCGIIAPESEPDSFQLAVGNDGSVAFAKPDNSGSSKATGWQVSDICASLADIGKHLGGSR